MDDIDRIIDEILNSTRVREGAAFSDRTYDSQPILQSGRRYRESYQSQARERGAAPAHHDGERHHRQGRKRPRPAAPDRADAQLSHPAGSGTTVQHPGIGSIGIRHAGDGKPAAEQPRPAGLDAQQQRPDTSLGTQRFVNPSVEHRPGVGQMPAASIPQRYYQLRGFAREQGDLSNPTRQGMLAYGTRSANRIFYEQARLMEDFEDDWPFDGDFYLYYPTYSSMSLNQLRGYFTWRARVRRKEIEKAPASFAFLYVYELLCGIGTTPGIEGYQAIRAFREAFLKTDAGSTASFSSYTHAWLRDYVVYHDLDPALAPSATAELPLAVQVLLRAEEAALEADGRTRRLAARSALPAGTPADTELLGALDVCSSYRISGSRLRRDHLDELRAVACAVFRALCVHCGRRRKTDYVEGLFGAPAEEFYVMFASAVFYDPAPHPDAHKELSPVESYDCRDGRWTRTQTSSARSSSRELGAVMRACDQRLRKALDYPYPLKERPVAKYVAKIIDDAIAQELERRREEERRRITIDLGALAHIRAAAATTQEALLTDEERDDGLEAPRAPVPDAPSAAALDTQAPVLGTQAPALASTAAEQVAGQDVTTSPGDAGVPDPSLGLSELEARVLAALIEGATPSLGPAEPPIDLVVDSINEKLFDLVGDAVIEFVSGEPAIIDDYLPDLKEALNQ